MKRADHRIGNDTTGFGRLRLSADLSFVVIPAKAGLST